MSPVQLLAEVRAAIERGRRIAAEADEMVRRIREWHRTREGQ